MISNNSIITIFSKTLILLINFSLVVFTARIWGSGGRGEIALIMANIALIIIINNTFSGSSIAYNSRKINKNELLIISFFGTLLTSIAVSVLFSFYLGFENFKFLLLISSSISLTNCFSSYYLGIGNIKWFNLITVLSPLLTLLIIFIFYYILIIKSITIFYYSTIISYAITFLISYLKFNLKNEYHIKYLNIKKIFLYGINNEISSFFQFLNYRISYIFIAFYINIEQLGIFSVTVALVESIWIVSRSISVNHYSEIINSNSAKKNILKTTKLASLNLQISVLLSVILILTPNEIFTFVFGDNFFEIKKYALYLIPGIIVISISNVHGHYFAGIGNLSVLKNKSYLGFIVTLICGFIFIPELGLLGACITLNISYITSSLYLFYNFKKQKNG